MADSTPTDHPAIAIATAEELREQLIWGFYEEEAPEYQQGGSPHELHELVTAEECNGLVENIAALRARVVEVEGEIEQAIKWQQFYMNKADAAEASMVEMAGALEKIMDMMHPITTRCEEVLAKLDSLGGGDTDSIESEAPS